MLVSIRTFFTKLWLKTKARTFGISPVEVHELLGYDPHDNQLSFYTKGSWDAPDTSKAGGKTTALLVMALSRATMKKSTVVVVHAPRTIRVCLDNLAHTTGLKWCKSFVKILSKQELLHITPDGREMYNDL